MRPASEAELTEMIRGANGPLTLRGGGTRGLAFPGGEVLESGALTGVELYEPGALTLVVRAGTPLAEVDALLAGERQRLAFEPPDLRGLLGRNGVSTIGGVVAANASGPRRVQAGACRDSLLGIRMVDGTGTMIKNGGRVMKNVTGYDLVKLAAGSRGSLGVLTEVSLRVQALPETEVTLVAERDLAAGLADLRAALGSPFDISGAGHDRGRALIRIEGMAGSVAYRAGELVRRLGGDWAQVTGAESAALWQGLRDVTAFHGTGGSVWRVVVKQTEAARVAAQMGGAAVADWGGGLLWLCLPGGQGPALRAALGADGHATLIRPAPDDAGTAPLPPEPAPVAALTRAIRAKFDPKGLFAQGEPA